MSVRAQFLLATSGILVLASLIWARSQKPTGPAPAIRHAAREMPFAEEFARAKAAIGRDGKIPVLIGLPVGETVGEWTREVLQDDSVTEVLAAQQGELVAFLESVDRTVRRSAHSFQAIPYVAVGANEKVIEALEALFDDKAAEEVGEVPSFEPTSFRMSSRLEITRGPRAYPYLLEQAKERAGVPLVLPKVEEAVTVVVIDNGIDYGEGFFGERVVAGSHFAWGEDADTIEIDPGDPAPGGPWSGMTEMSHGTHVAALIAGESPSMTGVDPRANLITIRVSSYPGGVETIWEVDVLRALEHVYEDHVLDSAGLPTNARNIVAVNISLRGDLYKDVDACDKNFPETALIVKLLWKEDIAVISASGNAGSKYGLSYPACVDSVVPVAATMADKGDTIWKFSNSHERLALWAPGSGIDASSLTGSSLVLSGTSFSAPFVTGAWAILNETHPGLDLTTYLEALTGKNPEIKVIKRKKLKRNLVDVAEALKQL